MKTVKHLKYLCIPLGYLLMFWAFKGQTAEPQAPNLKQLLLMPGKLTESHAHLENQCKQCHIHFDRNGQAPLCLDCHTTIKDDVDNKNGFHGHLPRQQLDNCSHCHSDHLGRNANIASFDQQNFDHNLTDFKLQGAHQKQSCQSCHNKVHPDSRKPTFLIPQSQCIDCHQDPHEGRLKEDCTSCHTQKNWQVSDFDHSKTDFALVEKHREIQCQSCHVKEISLPIGNQCSNCHQSVDNHSGVFGDKCDNCHNEKDWQTTEFDHLSKTEFALEGKHQQLSCAACHFEQSKPDKTCHDCHKQSDIHVGSNGTECQQCHNNEQWSKARFDHNRETDFVLQGAHKSLACVSCHLPGQPRDQSTAIRQCKDCHQDNDPHKKALGDQCHNCHQQVHWNEDVAFNHDFTDFPLNGSHGLQACQSCHQDLKFEIKQFGCIDCHKKDDFHEQALGEQCSDCHNVSLWQSWQFSHQSQTDYPLKGAHQNLSCALCHNGALPEPLKPPTDCFGCHKADDIHKGTFGKNCGQCHNKERFYDVQN